MTRISTVPVRRPEVRRFKCARCQAITVRSGGGGCMFCGAKSLSDDGPYLGPSSPYAHRAVFGTHEGACAFVLEARGKPDCPTTADLMRVTDLTDLKQRDGEVTFRTLMPMGALESPTSRRIKNACERWGMTHLETTGEP